MRRPDPLTDAMSRLTEAEMQLDYASGSAKDDLQMHLRNIGTDVRRARLRIEEFKGRQGPEIVDLRSAVCASCGGRFMSETIGMFAGLRWIHTCVPAGEGRVSD